MKTAKNNDAGTLTYAAYIVPLSVVVKTPVSQSGKQGSIPGHPTVSQVVIGRCSPLGGGEGKTAMERRYVSP